MKQPVSRDHRPDFAWFWQTGRRFLVGTPKAELKKWEKEILDDKQWREVREGLEVKLCPGAEGKETFLLCRSADRQKKGESDAQPVLGAHQAGTREP